MSVVAGCALNIAPGVSLVIWERSQRRDIRYMFANRFVISGHIVSLAARTTRRLLCVGVLLVSSAVWQLVEKIIDHCWKTLLALFRKKATRIRFAVVREIRSYCQLRLRATMGWCKSSWQTRCLRKLPFVANAHPLRLARSKLFVRKTQSDQLKRKTCDVYRDAFTRTAHPL